ncbi:hypothetical protein [Methanocaldococcus fervens]|uniref:Lipoprotein n=1 Tax=Methanocaldococcus fervens (strain DSM 4213 / JCM 15782 / AG86) TaxID=573064 RepID=C7P600_METFA|nr:hypothetical protein [Methanocaldococcus fervens]ACV23982.1 hypothetical protein Mefer_0140 [Methanocaldococcus fervens AG86]
MRKPIIFFLSLILIASICGCYDNEKDVDEVKNKSMENLNDEIVNNINDTNDILYNETNNSEEDKKYNFLKEVDIEDMFLNLPYEETKEDNNYIIKKYSKDGFNVTFEVSKEPIDFSYAYLYNDVREYQQRDVYGDYIYYEFIPKTAGLPVSYCYYREINGYYIVMQTFEKSRRANDLWLNWTKHIFSLFEE